MQRTIPFHQKAEKILYSQTKKLYLETKIDQINQKFKQSTLNKTQSIYQSEINIQNKAIRLESYINKELNNLEYEKGRIRQYLQEIETKQIKKRKLLSEMSQYRKLAILRLKKQIQLLIDLQREQSDEFLRQVQQEFNQKIKQQQKLLKLIKRGWKTHLRKILNQIEGGQNNQLNIKHLKDQIITANAEYNKKVDNLQLQIALKIQLFIEQCKNNHSKSFQKQIQLLNSVKDLESSLKKQVQKEHLQFHDNRQKLLLVFQEATQKLERKTNLEKEKKQAKFKSQSFTYRCQTNNR